ncbi:hypothetical protein C5167_005563 [Papaver somniferum]|uniref:Uncharacterized protein n=1 Tax=Papaver somniferum TaxID=3469 RepID=A0A4Y7JBT2_PAPSO|nr:hypothetical protein C5167_005563 [Papaver somniferum]
MASYAQEKPVATGVPVEVPMVPWSTGLCGCFDDCSNSCGTNGALYALIGVLTGCSWIYSCTYRTKFRQLYNLEGNGCTDCLTHFCCTSCALCQEYRELKNKGFDVPLGWQGNVARGTVDVVTAPPPAYGAMNR